MADNIRRCSDCKHFVSLSGGQYIGICTCSSNSFSYLPLTDFPQLFDCPFYHPKTSKIKPRRLCDFCERRIPILDDYGRYTMEIVKTESCPSVNLTTGERTEPDENGEYVLLIYDENGHGRDPGMSQIKFCPYCGRKLGGEKDG